MAERVLVVDDEQGIRETLTEVLREQGYDVTGAESGEAAITILREGGVDLVITDLRMPGASGLEVLDFARGLPGAPAVLVMTAFASIETAVDAMKRGAADYVVKPFLLDDVVLKAGTVLRSQRLAGDNALLRREIDSRFGLDKMVGRGIAMRRVLELVEKVGATNGNVLITGESGTGKELVARAVHHASPRRDRRFVAVNCGAIPENLIESELFGHVRGSFTGAVSDKEGLFTVARGGTLFLDEIGELPRHLQVKLLRAIEQREFLAVGGTRPLRADVRFLFATNRDLLHEVQEGRFREDFYYRLNVVEIPLPALRERREDIPLLVEHFVAKYNAELKRTFRGVSPEAMATLGGHVWRGNVRELENVIERAMILSNGEWIRVEDLPPVLAATAGARASEPPDGAIGAVAGDEDLKTALRDAERSRILDVLEKCPDKRVAAERLGVSLSSLYRKMEQLEIGSRRNRRLATAADVSPSGRA